MGARDTAHVTVHRTVAAAVTMYKKFTAPITVYQYFDVVGDRLCWSACTETALLADQVLDVLGNSCIPFTYRRYVLTEGVVLHGVI